MAGDRLDSDREINDLRDYVDALDLQRAALMASWIVSTYVKVESAQLPELNRDEVRQHWEPYSVIQLLTSRRDRRTDLIGVRKKQIEERDGKPVTVDQQGRWLRVKYTYLHAIAQECDNWQIPKDEINVPFRWMSDYTETEHERVKKRQAELIQKNQEQARMEYLGGDESTASQEFAQKAHHKFPWPFPGHRSPDHKQSA